jgi:hypothetical protein
MSTKTLILSGLRVGERFRVRSRSGSLYALTFLQHTKDVLVRMDDNRVARLDPHRIAWSTFAPASHSGEWVLVPGDEIVVETARRTYRGTLSSRSSREIRMEFPDGRSLDISSQDVTGVRLLFRARSLNPGDQFIVNSCSGREYSGEVLDVEEEQAARVMLEGGQVVRLRMERIDMNSLLVPVPLPLEMLLRDDPRP